MACPDAGPWQEIDEYARKAGVPIAAPTCEGTTGGDHAAGGFHPRKQARDYGDAAHSVEVLKQLFRVLEPLASGPNYIIAELFYDPMGYYYDDGARRSGSVDGNHGDHLHAAIRNGAHMPGVVVKNAVPMAGEGDTSGGSDGSLISKVADLFRALADPELWKRIGLVGLGSILVVAGLYTLEGDVLPRFLPKVDLPGVKLGKG